MFECNIIYIIGRFESVRITAFQAALQAALFIGYYYSYATH